MNAALPKEVHPVQAIEAVVTDVRLESRTGTGSRWQLALDRPVLSATVHSSRFGSKPPFTGSLEAVARSGARLKVSLIDVVEQDGIVWYVVDKPLLEGTCVRLYLQQSHPGAITRLIER